jgi:hypothetical protein
VAVSVDLPVDFAPNNPIKQKQKNTPQTHVVTGQYKNGPKLAHRTFAGGKKEILECLPWTEQKFSYFAMYRSMAETNRKAKVMPTINQLEMPISKN